MGLGEGNEKADGLARKGTSTQRTGKEFSKKRFRSQNITPTKSAIAQAKEPPEDICRENAARPFIQVHPDVGNFLLGSFKTEN